MLLGIVSDTHDDLDAVEAAVTFFERDGVDAVVHCGDFVAPFSATPFDAGFDFYAVRGNNDGEWNLQSVVDGFGTYLGEAGALSLDGRDIAVYHGTSDVLVDGLVDAGTYDYVLHGHTHAHGIEERGGTVRINPGGLPIPIEGADNVFRVATIDLDADPGADAVDHHVLDRP
ncbi:metallophosphoesterase [Halalkaliarchaeum sp. AArc-GB]|uniref:metallophosphoesterase n=1 Tax=Halalkaliarchaeum sp. AArc-GB TaxID=3074078 RepID=UPI00285F87B1|nr:metallophosphoesterase [Halalkaliarchaeum sp. AArc-GB]MDR5673516.1 metallophosphoesterase [Halalkaliarchaeum sp. AArc-GB]